MKSSDYDKLAIEYATTVNTKYHNAYYERPNMLKLIGNVQNKNVLELGCGTGFYTKELVNRGANVTAVDFSEEMIKYAEKYEERATYILHDLNNDIEFNDDEFDFVFASLFIHYIKDFNKLFRNIFLLMKNGGRFLFSTHNPAEIYSIFKNNYHGVELIEDKWMYGDKEYKVEYYARSFEEIITPLLNADFSLRKLIEPKSLPEFKDKDPVLFEKLQKEPGFLIIEAQKNC
ncbi:MAG: class I SAM-dependent methyltransferase [archaeon]